MHISRVNQLNHLDFSFFWPEFIDMCGFIVILAMMSIFRFNFVDGATYCLKKYPERKTTTCHTKVKGF